MNYFRTISFLAIIVTCLFYACKEEVDTKPVLKQEKNQVWSVKVVEGEHTKDAITYLETYEYDQKGNEIGHMVYNVDGSLSGKELSVFNDDFEQPVGTRYYTAEDSLLSYYTLKYDEKGNKISRHGFDAANDELLRIELFAYDAKGNMIRKDITNPDNIIQSSFIFTYDGFGNKTSMVSRDMNGSVRVTENYRITKYDENKQWVENWGWRNDQPVNFRSRELIFW